MKSILDPSFQYTRSFETDLRKTFDRIRGEQRRQEPLRAQAEAAPKAQVLPLGRASKVFLTV